MTEIGDGDCYWRHRTCERSPACFNAQAEEQARRDYLAGNSSHEEGRAEREEPSSYFQKLSEEPAQAKACATDCCKMFDKTLCPSSNYSISNRSTSCWKVCSATAPI